MQDEIRRNPLKFEIDEIRFAVCVMHGAFEQSLKMGGNGIRFDDLLCAGDVARAEGSPHFEGEAIRRHRQESSWRMRSGPARHHP